MPSCEYTVRRGSSNGPVVRTANVGDMVYHRWQCVGNGSKNLLIYRFFKYFLLIFLIYKLIADAYGMLVHSCQVEDSLGKRTEIVDANGLADFIDSMIRFDRFDLMRWFDRFDLIDSIWSIWFIRLFRCTKDRLLLPAIAYSNDLSLAYSQAQVFKYPDNSFIYFRCQIKICTKFDQACLGITVGHRIIWSSDHRIINQINQINAAAQLSDAFR